jgi:hypothetical protein
MVKLELDYFFKDMFWNAIVKCSLSLDEVQNYSSMRDFLKDITCFVFSEKMSEEMDDDHFDVRNQLAKKQGNYIIKYTVLMENEPDREDWWDSMTVEEFEKRAEAALDERIIISISYQYFRYTEDKKKLNIFDVYLDNMKSDSKRNKAKKKMLKAINTVGK